MCHVTPLLRFSRHCCTLQPTRMRGTAKPFVPAGSGGPFSSARETYETVEPSDVTVLSQYSLALKADSLCAARVHLTTARPRSPASAVPHSGAPPCICAVHVGGAPPVTAASDPIGDGTL